MNRLASAGILLLSASSLFIAGCGSSAVVQDSGDPATASPLAYTIDLNDRSDDTFKVTLTVDDLGPENAIYQFASTAPGTYQVMDVGRFVRLFEATDAAGTVIPSAKVSVNQWEISDPSAVAQIRYEVAETWDTPVEENGIFPMAGTSIEDDHTLITGQAVLGYPTGMQARPMLVTLEYPSSWTVGTAMDTDAAGNYLADDYDHFVDSPILMGRLSYAAVNVRGTDVEVFTYSKTDLVKSAQILESVTDILEGAGEFLVELPVDRYAFLFHFEDFTAGALEHSFSSEYVFAEAELGPGTIGQIRSIIAHEFFHIVTPLNIHSEVIEYFNFVEPVASEHVWLYEGTTEWVAHAAQLRAGLIDLDTYLTRLSGKMNSNDQFDPDFTLSQIGLESFSAQGQQQWGNIYQRGAIVAGLIDIKILEMSGGTRGYREVLLDLAKQYGPSRPFSEANFLDDFAEMTYPEVAPLFTNHVRANQTLPMAEYYGKLGIKYQAEVATGEQVAQFGLQVGVDGQNIVVAGVSPQAESCGMAVGDTFIKFEGQDVSLPNAQQIFGQFQAIPAGQEFAIGVRRDGTEHDLTCEKELVDEVDRHVFTVDPGATSEQVALREAWLKNLPLSEGT